MCKIATFLAHASQLRASERGGTSGELGVKADDLSSSDTARVNYGLRRASSQAEEERKKFYVSAFVEGGGQENNDPALRGRWILLCESGDSGLVVKCRTGGWMNHERTQGGRG